MTTRKKQIMWRFCRCCYDIIEYPHMNVLRKKHKNDEGGKHSRSPATTPQPKVKRCFVKLSKMNEKDNSDQISTEKKKMKHLKHKSVTETQENDVSEEACDNILNTSVDSTKDVSNGMRTTLSEEKVELKSQESK